jgi:hypothetical protein
MHSRSAHGAFPPNCSRFCSSIRLPLVAREQIGGGPDLYGVLLGVIGAVAGAFLLPWAKARFGADRLMALGALGQAIAMLLYGFVREPVTALAASARASWIGALATLSVSAQVALPDLVRARGLALYTTENTARRGIRQSR